MRGLGPAYQQIALIHRLKLGFGFGLPLNPEP